MHDLSVQAMNNGVTINDMSSVVKMPEVLTNN
jgi:alkyl sulfatase BDS1-like metallo-beta-lactamase superfamily hydrolase